MKVFISQRMHGLTVEGIKKDRQPVIDYFNPDTEFLVNYVHQNAPDGAGRLWHLGESIKQLMEADLVIFTGDWYNAKGCLIEFEICKKYGLTAGVFGYDKDGNPHVVKLLG